ncbi:MutS-related protein [Carboxylicivirga sp. N1Y90]|uniref:MutS-related protein n=1 Tax=Carboxylicivirga fragile TaxID=3417571 RepID=UPI003D33BB10|nr:hypothetical protein [Marinilabiliaceae bacterium N1Y90]
MEEFDGQQLVEKYQEKKQFWINELTALKKRSLFVSWFRLFFFVATFAVPFYFFQVLSSAFLLSGVFFLVGFIILVYYANKLSYQRKYATYYIELLDRELRIQSGNWTDEIDGSDLIDPNHDYSHDLDLFGKGSLFQYINRTATKAGYKRLASKLNSISLDADEIRTKQEGLQELTSLETFREQFYVLASFVKDRNKKVKEIDPTSVPDISFIGKGMKSLTILFPIITTIVIALSIFGVIDSILILYLFFAGLIITGSVLRKINLVHNEVSALGRYLSRYSNLIAHVETQSFESAFLKNLSNQLKTDGKSASQVVRELGKIIQLFDQRLNMLMGAILNGLFLWDLNVCLRLRSWYKVHNQSLVAWVDTLSEIEAQISLASFCYNHSNGIYPTLSDTIVFEAKSLGHPLIPTEERVNNDFSIGNDRRICVVTGANMAGKSTFLRTVGCNLVLAGNGCIVVAESFTYRSLPFVTNMRAVDNLLKHESYFFAELSRLQMIVERLKEKGEIFFILDEILKGTNSHDKTTGSQALIKQLLKLNGSGIIATHDLELGELAEEHPGKIFNNCFEVSFVADNLEFDYTLRDGVTQSHNASFLMRKMGLIPKA